MDDIGCDITENAYEMNTIISGQNMSQFPNTDGQIIMWFNLCVRYFDNQRMPLNTKRDMM
jgi:hypothetical protein